MIRMTDAKLVAQELHTRYEPMRAVVLISRAMQKAVFAGRSDDVVFWALVYANYRGADLSDATAAQLAAFRDLILPEIDDRPDTRRAPAPPKRRMAKR